MTTVVPQITKAYVRIGSGNKTVLVESQRVSKLSVVTRGLQGPPGHNGVTIHVGSEPPEDTEALWLDTGA